MGTLPERFNTRVQQAAPHAAAERQGWPSIDPVALGAGLN
jgi:hypothetical protein